MSWRRMYLWKASGGTEQDHQYLGRWKVNESIDMYKKLSFMPCTSCIFLCCTNPISLCHVLDIYVHMTYMLIYGLGYSSLWRPFDFVTDCVYLPLSDLVILHSGGLSIS